MNKHEPLPPVIAADDLGLTIRLACAIGQNRQVEFGIGVPLGWPEDKLNEHVDKLIRVVERQAAKGDLLSIKGTLQTSENQLETTREQIRNHEAACRDAWMAGNRQGPFRMSASQQSQLANFQNTEQQIVKNIQRLREELKVVEERCR